jgi:hypothetical protein
MPLAILAAANAAVKAIQQGCELYQEYKGTVLEAKKTLDTAVGIAKEVSGASRGFWSFLKGKLFGEEEEKPQDVCKQEIVQEKKAVKKAPPPDQDELTITLDIIAQLKVFFTCMTQLKQKLADAELHSLDAKSDAELLSSSVDIEYAMTEVAKLQKQIRETMVYQIGGDLGDLYTKVVKRVGIIQEQQEAARLTALRKKKEEQARKAKQEAKRHKRLAIAAIVILITAETWGLMAAIVIANT